MDVRLRFIPALILFFTIPAFGEGPHVWEQSKFEDFSKGTAQGIAIRSKGGIEPTPEWKEIATTPSTYIWSITSDKDGNVFAAAGSPARVYRITPDGKSTVIFEPQELQVQALISYGPAIYAATNPDGKVYELTPNRSGTGAAWNSKVYFDPATKYIWALLLDDAGNLFVATGDKGEIFRVTKNGQHSVFFKSDEAHIRVLARDTKGNLIAGSDGSGLVYRISPSGEAFVLYSAAKKEITALAVDKDGNIFAAGVGEKRPGNAPAVLPAQPFPTTTPTPSAIGQPAPGITLNAVASALSRGVPLMVPGANPSGGSEIYRIAADGTPTRIWTSRDDLVYALAFDSTGHLLAGTGNQGHIYSIISEDDFTDLLRANANQVTGFAKAPEGGLYISASNLGKILLLTQRPEEQGTYESDVFDAHIFSSWGRAEVRGTPGIELFARSGNVDNPDRNWGPWAKVDLGNDAPLNVPLARFVQWKAVLRQPARLDSVKLYYQSKNVAPDFDDVSVQLGVRYQSLPKSSANDAGMMAGPQQPLLRIDPAPITTRDSDSIGVKWSVHDNNDDQMSYTLYYRGDQEKHWLLLKDKITDKFYSFDASLLPDGGYAIKVVASDAPSHSPADVLTSERESAHFEVDTTPPQIQIMKAALTGNEIQVVFTAKDFFSAIDHAEYSVDAQDWQYIEPGSPVAGAKFASYDFKIPVPGEGKPSDPKKIGEAEHVVVVRVYDRFDNMSTAKMVVRKTQ